MSHCLPFSTFSEMSHSLKNYKIDEPNYHTYRIVSYGTFGIGLCVYILDWSLHCADVAVLLSDFLVSNLVVRVVQKYKFVKKKKLATYLDVLYIF